MVIDLSKTGFKAWKCEECGQIVYSASKQPLTFMWTSGHVCQFREIKEVGESIVQDTMTIESLNDLVKPVRAVMDKAKELLRAFSATEITETKFQEESLKILEEFTKEV